jgi:hypothetical protein
VRIFVSFLLLGVFLIGHSHAREFPALSKAGTLRGFDRPFVKIGSTTYQLAPAARIIDQGNRLIQPATLPSGAKIIYKIEAQTGLLHNLWLLAPGEVVTIQR